MRRSHSICVLLHGAALTASALTASAQTPVAPPAFRAPPPPFAVVNSIGALTRTTDARRAESVPRQRSDFAMRVDSAPGGTLHARLALDLRAQPALVATVRLPIAQGRFQLPTFEWQPQPERPWLAFGRFGGSLPLPQRERNAIHATTRQLIELAALFESAPAAGTIDRRVTHYDDGSGDYRLVMDAERRSRTLRDTVIRGRRAHVVRDTTAIALTHAYGMPARFVDRAGRAREITRGTITGVRFVDAESQRAFAMYDTLVMTGTYEADDGFGGHVESPLFVRAVRESSLRDSIWQAATPREQFDMVRYDGARRGAPTAAERDSLLAVLPTTPRLAARDSIRGMLLAGNPRELWPRMVSASLAAGDTGSIVTLIGDYAATRRRTVSADEYALLSRALGDATVAFRTGVDRELLAVNLIDALLSRPPVLATRAAQSTTADGGVACEPAACQAMTRDAQSRASLPLQAVGLVAAMVTSPREWTDSVVKHAASNPFLPTRALWFALGTSSTATASAKDPIPSPDGPFAAWMHWLTAEDSAYVRARDSDTSMRRIVAAMNRPRPIVVPEAAVNAIRFAEARTGRRYADAFRSARDRASTDSARALYNALLIAMGDAGYSDADMVRIMLSRDDPQRAAVREQLTRQLRNSYPLPLASDSVARVVGRHVVNMVFADSVVTMPSGDPRFASWYRVPKSVDSLPLYVVLDSLPESVRARAAELGFKPVTGGRAFAPGESGYEIRISPIRRQGPFVVASVTHTQLYSRSSTRSGGYAGGFTLLLVETASGWVIVDASAWVT